MYHYTHTQWGMNSYDIYLALRAPPYFPALYHYGYNDAGYRGSQVNPTLTLRLTCMYTQTYAGCDAQELNIEFLFAICRGRRGCWTVVISAFTSASAFLSYLSLCEQMMDEQMRPLWFVFIQCLKIKYNTELNNLGHHYQKLYPWLAHQEVSYLPLPVLISVLLSSLVVVLVFLWLVDKVLSVGVRLCYHLLFILTTVRQDFLERFPRWIIMGLKQNTC